MTSWVKQNLKKNDIQNEDIKIKILCYPRIFGFVFNPLSVFYVYNLQSQLISILYEVKNTFGEQHTYIFKVSKDVNLIQNNCTKKFHVSPFIEMDCNYFFRLLKPGEKISEIKLDRVFIGSCTNGRIEDLREAAEIVEGKKVAQTIDAMIVPGSTLVKKQAEEEGLDRIFTEAGFDWREAGCSMCLGMNPDILSPGERCASTSNRNYGGRQGVGGRTHLVSPKMAAAAALHGKFVDIRDI